MAKQMIEDMVENLLSQMTLAEKVAQMMQLPYTFLTEEDRQLWIKRGIGSFLHVLGQDAQRLQDLTQETRLKIPLIFGIDCVRGHALNPRATIFPSPLSMGASFNPDMLEKVGRVSAEEVTEDALHWVFSPLLCLARDTRWGRVGETFGEDSFLTGAMAAAMVKGYQGYGGLQENTSVAACAKHYIAYGESTGGRDSYDVSVTERKIREIFLPPFQRVIEAGCKTVMAAYHSIDGLPCSANKWLIRDLLKGELKFDGFVVTDWNNVGRMVSEQCAASDIREAAKLTVEAGNDMIMSTPEFYEAAISLVKSGELAEELIDDSVCRILKVKLELGISGEKKDYSKNITKHSMACHEHLDVNAELTDQTVVLLENKNNILPLSHNITKIAVVGSNADNLLAQYGDWTFFTHPAPDFSRIPKAAHVSVWDGIREAAPKYGAQAVYAKGCPISRVLECCEGADVVIAVIGDDPTQNGEEKDRADLVLSSSQQKILESIKRAGYKLVVVGVSGKPLAIPWVKEHADALLWSFCPGMFGGCSIARVLFGEVNPSAKLPISFPQSVGQIPVYYNQLPGWHGGKYMDLPREPLYPFGYGLSYSSFKFTNLSCDEEIPIDTELISLTVDVANTSELDGTVVVQWYIRDMVSSVLTPVRQLKGFERISLKAGESRKAFLALPMAELSIVNTQNQRIVEKGTFRVFVGDGLQFTDKEFNLI